jgi:hypothetical protein
MNPHTSHQNYLEIGISLEYLLKVADLVQPTLLKAWVGKIVDPLH